MRTCVGLRMLALAALAVVSACSDTNQNVTDIAGPQAASVSSIASLGQKLFEDANLSLNRNQSCRTCHEPSEGFAAALSTATTVGSVVQGSASGKFGARKPPTAAYITSAPLFTSSNSGASGGIFWDGRATGQVLGSPAADQALGPFLNPVEQALPDAACLVHRVRNAAYVADYTTAWGSDILSIVFPGNVDALCSTPVSAPGEFVTLAPTDRAKVVTAYHNIALSIKEFEATFNQANSRFDLNALTALEKEGAKLFSSKGKCHQCHSVGGSPVLFTDFAYHNLGVPKNPANPAFNYSTSAFDKGLGGFTLRPAHVGKFKTPTVRNVGKGSNRTYMHNGVLTSLKQVVDFYNTRDALPRCSAAQIAILPTSAYGSYGAGCWPAPEYGVNMDTKQMGKLGLSDRQVDAIVAFMMALSDQ